jgi:hypothetical protein
MWFTWFAWVYSMLVINSIWAKISNHAASNFWYDWRAFHHSILCLWSTKFRHIVQIVLFRTSYLIYIVFISLFSRWDPCRAPSAQRAAGTWRDRADLNPWFLSEFCLLHFNFSPSLMDALRVFRIFLILHGPFPVRIATMLLLTGELTHDSNYI